MLTFSFLKKKQKSSFYAILDELEMPDSFLDTGMLSFRVTPKPDKVDVFVTKSKIDQNLDFEDLSDLPDMEELAQMSPDEFIKPWKKASQTKLRMISKRFNLLSKLKPRKKSRSRLNKKLKVRKSLISTTSFLF